MQPHRQVCLNNTVEGSRSPTALVTGATSGIGLATATALAAEGWRVIIHGRSESKCVSTVAVIRRAVMDVESRARSAEFIEPEIGVCDLANLADVHEMAERIGRMTDSLDALINNAGIFSSRRGVTKDGFEMHLGVNHLAPFVLTQQLLHLLEEARNGRIIAVSSGSHRFGRIHWNNLQLSRFYSGVAAYSQSKLANNLFSYELQRRLPASSRIDSFAMEPGLVNTELGEKRSGWLVSSVWSRRKRHGVTPEEGAATSVMLATNPEIEGKGGSYWAAGLRVQPSPRSLSEADGARLWRLSSELCSLTDNPVL